MLKSTNFLKIAGLVWMSLLLANVSAQPGWKAPQLQPLFQSGTNGYQQIRIPALIRAADGSLIAFAEARKTPGDAGDIDLVARRSTDKGLNWGPVFTVWDDGENTCGNPCPVLDRKTGNLFLLMTKNRGTDIERDIIRGTSQSTRTVWISQSNDHGKTWSKPREITSQAKKPEWGWYATGPGVGIQVQQGPHHGRLVIPCDFSYADQAGNVAGGGFEYGSHIIYSDDGGKNWQIGGTITPKVNECQVVELADGNGTLLMNMRSYFGRNRRTQSISYDGGLSWTDPADVPELVEPVCQAGLVGNGGLTDQNQQTLLFTNPASSKFRHNLSIRASFDHGQTWKRIQTIFPGPSAYSSLTYLPDNQVGLLFEGGERSPYEKIYFTTIPMDWLNE